MPVAAERIHRVVSPVAAWAACDGHGSVSTAEDVVGRTLPEGRRDPGQVGLGRPTGGGGTPDPGARPSQRAAGDR
jgi:hypothetical protein